MDNVITCTRCRAPLPVENLNTPDMTSCPACRVGLNVAVFPSFFNPQAPGQPGEALILEQEASCFYHPQKKAVIPCGICGRFLCALCDIELHGQHLCPACLEAGKDKGKLQHLEKHRVLYDEIALRLAVYPIVLFFILWFVSILTAPLSIFIVIRYWNAPKSLVRRGGRIRMVIAILLASLQLVGWGFLFFGISELMF